MEHSVGYSRKYENWLFSAESNAPIEIFRIAFGLLMLAEAWGAIATGWVRRTFVDVNYTFPFFGFEWTQVLIGTPMYGVFFLMGVFSIGVMLGYKYKYSIVFLAILWSLTYLMQKSNYNNHYYLVMVVSWIFVFLPVGKRFALDAKKNPAIYRNQIPAWPRLLFMCLIAIVYFFAAINKLYPDWLEARPLTIWMTARADLPIIGPLLQIDWVPHFLSYAGIGYDLLVVPMLLWKRTRWFAIIASLGFHLFNSAVFQIGIFPYFALAFSIFFFPTKSIEKLVSKDRILSPAIFNHTPTQKALIKYAFAGFIGLMLVLPVRHHFIPDDVLWTEAGHRLSWRMMLRTKSGIAHFTIETDQNKQHRINLRERLGEHQINGVSTRPDMMFTFARYLEEEFLAKGYSEVSVYVNTRVSVNGRPLKQFTDPEMDLLDVRWNYFGNQEWVLPRPW
ncbi:MAG: HTTM domain-containing protein [Saprospirales bacterium]|nr:MAG: HTTM domain-containing protein [Saprospirales bacterium]